MAELAVLEFDAVDSHIRDGDIEVGGLIRVPNDSDIAQFKGALGLVFG